jgi:hypothetical protein
VKMTKAVRDGSARCSCCRCSLSALRTVASSAGDGGGSISIVGGGMMVVSGDAFGVIPTKSKKDSIMDLQKQKEDIHPRAFANPKNLPYVN